VPTHDEDTAITDVHDPVALGGKRDCLIVVYQRDKDQQGKRLELAGGVARIGRDQDNDLVLLDEGVSRRHARVERSRDGWIVMDVGSRNGTLLNGKPLTGVERLNNGDVIKVGSAMVKYLSGQDVETSMWEEVFQLAITDNLTGLRNRRRFDEVLVTECGRERRHGRSLSLIMLDIDYFKRVNDRHGHPAGDAVLAQLGQLIRERVRGHDLAARVGGEELAILMPETDLPSARAVAEELRLAVQAQVVDYAEKSIRVTVSIGCAEYAMDDVDPASFVRRCDAQLYAAKSAGRNRVCG
jgi:two-component system, cell cycle response regulator